MKISNEIPTVFNVQGMSFDGSPVMFLVPVKGADGKWSFLPRPEAEYRTGRFARVVKDRAWVEETPENTQGLTIPSEANFIAEKFKAVGHKTISASGRVVEFEFESEDAALAFVLSEDMAKNTARLADTFSEGLPVAEVQANPDVPRLGFWKPDCEMLSTDEAS